MKAFKDYDKTKAYTEKEVLPAGGYVLRILHVKYEAGTNGNSDQIVLSFDIAEGEYLGFYDRNYAAQTQEDKKWKGTYRFWVPSDDGSEKDEWTKRRFKTIIMAFEDSNPGYFWNWDENTLKGKLIGGIFNRKEYDFNGRNGFFTRCYSLTDVDTIRNGNFEVPADTLLKVRPALETASADDDFMKVPDNIDLDELPFR